MGKKRTLEDKTKYAFSNGYVENDATVDSKPVRPEPLDYTRGCYETQLELWDHFRKGDVGGGVSDLQSLKRFAKFIALSTEGILDADGKPTQVTVRNYFRRFSSGWNLIYPENPISRDYTDSVTNYIKGSLTKEIPLSTLKRKPTYLTVENYLHLEKQLWQKDSFEYVHDGCRVFMSTKLKIHVYTTARIGEISESTARRDTGKGLRYRDTVMLVAWKDGGPELRLSLKREFSKGMHNKDLQKPTHILYESLPGQLLVVQPLLFMIAIFLAFGAFKKYTNIQQILAIKPPQGESHWVLDWADSVLDQPIFPQMSADGPTDKIQSATSFHDQLRRLSERSGMENHVTIHSGRREALIIATGLGYPKDELTKFAAHTNPNTLATSYLSSMSSVDGLAGYLGLPLRSDQVEDFRTLTVSRNPDLLLSLPAKEHDELRQSSEWISIDNELKELSGRTLDAETKALASTLKGKLRKLERAKLIEARRNRVRIHPSERQGPLREDRDRSKWKRIQHLIPERDELSKLLFTQAPLRSEEGISAVNYLISLLKTSTKTAYQPSFRPTAKGECPVPGCSVLLERESPDSRWKHVFECSRDFHQQGNNLATFCFDCSEWFVGLERWESHCQNHIETYDIPVHCDLVRFRTAIACPGRCIVCLHNEQAPATRRMYGFMKQVSWERHINACYTSYLKGLGSVKSIPCPSPLCATAHQSENEAWYHLYDAHSYPLRQHMQKEGRKRKDPFIIKEQAAGAIKRPRKISAPERSNSQEIPLGFLENSLGSPHKSAADDLKPSLPCIENEVENGLALETYYSWSGSGLETSTANTSSAEPITQEIPGPASFTPAEIDPLLLAETDAMLQHIQEPLKLQNKDSKMTNESPDYDSYSEVSGKSSEEEYTVEKLLAVWKERRNKHYLVKWATGGVSWQPEENIDQSLISDFGGYAGFKEGVKVVSFQRRKGKPMYRLQFLDYVGAEKDKYWWVPESTVHPDLRKTDRRGKPSRRA